MLSQLQLILPILAIFAVNSAAGYYQYIGDTERPDTPNHCFYEEYDLIVPVNKTLYPPTKLKTCIKLFCRDDYVLVIRQCDRVGTCEISENDYTKRFPDCCPLITCPNGVYRTRDDD